MVTSNFNLTRNGVKDWVVQRVSAVILAVFSIFIFSFIMAHPNMSFATWTGLFHSIWMQWFTVLTVLALIGHAWVGIWTVLTDYVHNFVVRSVLMIGFIFAFLFYLVWVINIVWS